MKVREAAMQRRRSQKEALRHFKTGSAREYQPAGGFPGENWVHRTPGKEEAQ